MRIGDLKTTTPKVRVRAAKLPQHDDNFRPSQHSSDRGQIVPEQSSPLRSKSSASTRNPSSSPGSHAPPPPSPPPPFEGRTSYHGSFSSPSPSNPPLPARLESVSASPIPPSRRTTSGVPTRSSSRGADAKPRQPSSGDGELRAAVFDRLATGVGHSLGSAADRERAAS